MRIRTIIAAAAIPAAAATTLLTATGASAAVHHPALHQQHKIATASLEVNGQGYEQYQQFVALSGFGRYHGWESYTNDQYAMPGSGVWAPANVASALGFKLNGVGQVYQHTLNSDLVLKALGPNNVRFSGSGHYNANPSTDTWTIKGGVYGKHVTFTLTYGSWGGSPAYVVTAKGMIAADGSATGTATAVHPSQNLTWSLGKGTFQQVLHFVAPIKSDVINGPGQNVSITFVIPATWNGAPVPYAGATLTLSAHNGHSPAHDTFSQGVNGGAQVSETVVAGHIQIHRLP